MSDSLFLLILLCVSIGPILILLFYQRDLFFRRTPFENARVIHQEGPGNEIERYFVNAIRDLRRNTNGFIVAGEANPYFWTANVCKALEEAYDNRNVQHLMICGPVLLLDPKTGKSCIIELAKKGKIKLYVSRHRQKEHFRVATNGRLYWEAAHDPGQKAGRVGYNFPSNRYEAKPYIKRFKRLLKSMKLSLDPENDFLLLDREPFLNLCKKVKERKKEYNYCDMEEFRRIIGTS